MTVSTEARHPLSVGLHALPPLEVLERILEVQKNALSALSPVLPQLAQAAELGASALARGRRMGYAGAGASGLMALADCLELPGTFGIPPDRVPVMFAGGAEALLHMTGGAEDDQAQALADFTRAGLEAGDVLLCLAASGRTPYTVSIARTAKARGVTVVALSNVADTPLLAASDLPIVLETGAEIITGSTRMSAASVQKTALNMISVLLGIQLGHVHDGFMVNLTADNIKLIDRAARIVASVSGADRLAAEQALAQSGGGVKEAILIAQGQSPEAAKAALQKSEGHLAPHLPTASQ